MYYDLCANSGYQVCVCCCYSTSQPCPLLQLLADQRNQAREFMPEHNTLTLTYVMKHMHIHIHTTHKESAQERYDTHHITRSCFCVFTSSTVHTTSASCCLLHLHPYYYSLPGPRLRQIASPLSISRCCPGWKISFALQKNCCQDICMLSVHPKIEGATRGELMLKPNSRFPHNSQSS